MPHGIKGICDAPKIRQYGPRQGRFIARRYSRLKKMKLSASEMETVIRYNNDELSAWIFTDCPKLIKKLKALPASKDYEIQPHEGRGLKFRCPKKWIRIKPPVKRNLSDEQRQLLAERLKKSKEKS